MVLQQEVEVLPRYPLLVTEAGRLHHGLDAVLRLALRQSAVGDFDERPAARQRSRIRDMNQSDAAIRGKKKNESKGNCANRSILANSCLDSEPVPPMSFMVNISMDFSSGDPD